MIIAFVRTFILVAIIGIVLFFAGSYVNEINKKAGYYMYRCSDFKNHAEAQKAFDTKQPEYSKLDKNHDGIACSSLK